MQQFKVDYAIVHPYDELYCSTTYDWIINHNHVIVLDVRKRASFTYLDVDQSMVFGCDINNHSCMSYPLMTPPTPFEIYIRHGEYSTSTWICDSNYNITPTIPLRNTTKTDPTLKDITWI